MISAKVNNQFEFEIDNKENLSVNHKIVDNSWINIGNNKFHGIVNNQSVTVELHEIDETGKQQVILVNGVKYQVALTNQFDKLLMQLGLDKISSNKQNTLKAPMPGLVLKVNVSAGIEIKKGDSLMVLEAMKMENVIKASFDGKVKKVLIIEKQAVEKGQVLFEFE